MAKYDEREITQPVLLCDAKGNLNPDAVGWSRFPLHTCNLSGHFPRKKKWHFWNVICEDFAIAFTIANVDYLGVGAIQLIKFKEKQKFDGAAVIPRGIGVKMPNKVEENVSLKDSLMKLSFTHEPGVVLIKASSPSVMGKPLEAEIKLDKPADHETLNVVIPWGPEEFHFTSKQNTLPASGMVKYGDETLVFKPENSYGVLDFGRGMWPKTIYWNWGAFNHRQDGDLIGINIGSKWTDNTGQNENGICINGKLYKIMEDLEFKYDTSNFMAPWHIRTPYTDMMDLILTPTYENSGGGGGTGGSEEDKKKVAAANHQMYGYFNGTLNAGGKKIEIKNAFGWAEEHIGNW